MTELTPVPWEDLEAATGPPTATEVREYVAEMTGEVSDAEADRDGFETVKTAYDAWKTDRGEDRALSDQAAAFVVAYLLEREGVIDLSDAPQGSLVERRPSAERLRELFWEREQTLWWIAVECGVHYSLVTFWLWEDDVPLAERNLSDATQRQIEGESGN
ncbi:hypothetical protein M0R88_10110 [Halorussus gelatinilyticus]|uniref:Uncharacterized protein n=1 Tax=Halorussus gelatinilyticus TaxID=2937524 RepID=A0A8U0ICW3_9EURY|nr:hypothetical protein [Halorussus gelatinilyticus]UPV98886.1 hypothetical protein M0R88_10110 [Halorussus gelatinilyticus]